MLTNEQLALKHVTLPILAVFMTLGNGALILITLRHNSCHAHWRLRFSLLTFYVLQMIIINSFFTYYVAPQEPA